MEDVNILELIRRQKELREILPKYAAINMQKPIIGILKVDTRTCYMTGVSEETLKETLVENYQTRAETFTTILEEFSLLTTIIDSLKNNSSEKEDDTPSVYSYVNLHEVLTIYKSFYTSLQDEYDWIYETANNIPEETIIIDPLDFPTTIPEIVKDIDSRIANAESILNDITTALL